MEDTTNTPTTPGNEANFTANETKLVCAIMQNLTTEIQFDVEKVALELGYKNGSSLRARWNSLKRSKIATSSSGGAPAGGVDKGTPSKKTKSTPKKAKAAEAEDGEESPKKLAGKKGGKGKAKGKGVKVEVKTEEEDDALESIEGSSGIAVAGSEMGDEGEVSA